MKYTIDIEGSEGTTSVILDLTPDELLVMIRLAITVNDTSRGICEPTISIHKTSDKELTP